MSCDNTNPFEMVYSALWECVLAHPRFAMDVKERNRIRFDLNDDRNITKQTIAAADLPEVALFCQSLTSNIYGTSSTSQVTRNYTWLISTGDMRYVGEGRLAQVEWCIFTAMHGWKAKLGALQWQGKSFVKRVGAPSGQSAPFDKERNKNLAGWSAVWSADVEMHFATADLVGELELTQ